MFRTAFVDFSHLGYSKGAFSAYPRWLGTACRKYRSDYLLIPVSGEMFNPSDRQRFFIFAQSKRFGEDADDVIISVPSKPCPSGVAHNMVACR